MPPPQSRPQKTYLLSYNLVSLALWATLTLRLLILLPPALLHADLSLSHAHDLLFPLLQFTQSLALLEILHSLTGLVRAPLFTTLIQVASRILVVWGVLWMFPEIVVGRNEGGIGRVFRRRVGKGYAGDVAEVGALLAWGVTECVRYGFFVATLRGTGVPRILQWARYNTFFLLYPIGIASECWLIYLALKPAGQFSKGYEMLLRAVLLIYIPGSYILYTHMMAQRRRVMRGKQRAE